MISSSADVFTLTGPGRSRISPGAISADGRYVTFESLSTNLVAGDTNGVWDIFVRDLVLGTIYLVSVNTNGRPANRLSYRPVITADGRFVAFLSEATDLASDGDTPQQPNLYVRDLVNGTTVLANRRSDGSPVPFYNGQ